MPSTINRPIIRATMRFLPPEIWELIAQFLLHTEPSDPYSGPYNQHSVAQLCLTSKTLHRFCTSVLYSDINPHVWGGHDLFQTIVQNQDLGRLVKSLRLEHGHPSLFVSPKNMTPMVQNVCDQYFETLQAILSVTGSSLTAWNRHGTQYLLQQGQARVYEILPPDASESILLSMMPNLRKLDIDTEAFFPGVQQGALARLVEFSLRQPLHGRPMLEFTNLRFLAEAATSLTTMSLIGVIVNFYDDGWASSKTPMFSTVTNLNISGCNYTTCKANFFGLEISVAAFVRSFPRLESFRLQASGRMEIPCKPKIKSLLQALSQNASELKHLCLEELVTRQEITTSQDPLTTWAGALDELSQLKPLQSLTIDMGSLCPHALLNDNPLCLLEVLPDDLHHLHLLTDETRWVDLDYLQPSFCELARMITEEGKFRHLKRITFTSKIMRGKIGRALDALKKAGILMVRQATLWNDEEGPYTRK